MKDEMNKTSAGSDMTDGKNSGIRRRAFFGVDIAGGLGAITVGSPAAAAGDAGECLELPPENAETFNATCQYCMAQCGHKVSVWERGTGHTPEGEYAGAIGDWISPTMSAPVEKGGKEVYAAIVPDSECKVAFGGQSVRGGTCTRGDDDRVLQIDRVVGAVDA